MIEGGLPEDAAVVVDYSLTTDDTFAARLAASRYRPESVPMGRAAAHRAITTAGPSGDGGLCDLTRGIQEALVR